MSLINTIDWNLLGRDVWREIFWYLSFDERQRLRCVSTVWNLWILEYKPFWSLDHSIYSKILNNLGSSNYKRIDIKLNHSINKIIAEAEQYILISAFDEFWIYSKTSFKMLYTSKGYILDYSKEHFILDDKDFYYCLSFNYTTIPEEIITLNSKVKIYKSGTGDFCRFDYPYITFENFYEINQAILIDVRSGIDLLEQNRVLVPKDINSPLLYNGYYGVFYDEELWIFKIEKLTSVPFKVIKTSAFNASLCDGFYLEGVMDGYERFISSHRLDCNKVIKIDFKEEPNFESNFVYTISKDRPEKKIYRWNSDYTELTLFTTLNQADGYLSCIDTFDPSLPLSAFEYKDLYDNFSFMIFSRKGKELFKLDVDSNQCLSVDKYLKIYKKTVKDQEIYLTIIDFTQ